MIRAAIANALLSIGVAAAIAGCSPAAEPRADGAAPGDQSVTLAPLFQEPLPDIPGKTFTSAIVTLPPAGHALPHRHGDAFVYAYVLKGTVSSQLEGQPVHVYHQGENWSEDPGAHHLSTENTSHTELARLLVVFVATTGEQLKVDDPHA